MRASPHAKFSFTFEHRVEMNEVLLVSCLVYGGDRFSFHSDRTEGGAVEGASKGDLATGGVGGVSQALSSPMGLTTPAEAQITKFLFVVSFC